MFSNVKPNKWAFLSQLSFPMLYSDQLNIYYILNSQNMQEFSFNQQGPAYQVLIERMY